MKLKVKKAGFGSIVNLFKENLFKEIFKKAGVQGSAGSIWSKENMAGLSKYAPNLMALDNKLHNKQLKHLKENLL
jgi:hypothetical protein